jgi:hypothetical protein
MAQTCTTVGDVWWNGLGAALIGGLTAALVATGVVLATRAYELRHINEQEARAAARELMKESSAYLNALGNAITNSPEDLMARAMANWTWMGAVQGAQASIHTVKPKLVERVTEAAKRAKDLVAGVDAIGDTRGPAWRGQMHQAVVAAAVPVLRLNMILAEWIATGKVLDLD